MDRAEDLGTEADDPLRETTAAHYIASKHEQWHCDHEVAVAAIPYSLRKHLEKKRVRQQICDASCSDSKSKWYSDDAMTKEITSASDALMTNYENVYISAPISQNSVGTNESPADG